MNEPLNESESRCSYTELHSAVSQIVNLRRVKKFGGLRVAGCSAECNSAILLFLLLLACQCCFAVEDTNIVAAGDWSAPVTGLEDMTGRGAHHPTLRGRLLLCESPKNHQVATYLELQDCGDTWGSSAEVYCDMTQRGGCHLEFHTISGQLIPPRSRGTGGGNPGANWVTLPSDSTVRLRVSAFASFSFVSTNDYFMSGTFTVDPPPDHTGLDVWQGALKLPPVKVSAQK